MFLARCCLEEYFEEKEITMCKLCSSQKITSQEEGGNISRSGFGSMVGVFQRRRARRFCCIGRTG